ncbi:DNA-directed RNA polymerase III subunit RPC7-like isoform X2 [Protopterus annectens]|uniref:DNA-directed RNA polymerase III subunit RPC7-like isoform X2 n=1 Tax=Protopterus annectens TaxID=7888 RepID=UPI001CF95230|nr:DNA-directed RNA polymerase III subunit RPC7-like isoform X2 [Protopterus annectens]
MAGRGRGRGRGQMTFNVEAVGIGKGETLPPPTLQPPPLFPALDYKPVPLQTGEEVEYMLALKQELRGAMKSLPYYVKPAAPKKDIERYTDKYQVTGPVDNAIDWNPDWKRLPQELKIKVRKQQKEKPSVVIPRRMKNIRVDKEEIIKKLEIQLFYHQGSSGFHFQLSSRVSFFFFFFLVTSEDSGKEGRGSSIR